MSGTDWKAKALEYEYMMDEQRRRTGVALAELQEQMAQLRLAVKGLVYDLERTRHERDTLIAAFEENFTVDDEVSVGLRFNKRGECEVVNPRGEVVRVFSLGSR